MRYYATPGTIALRKTLSQGVVLRDTHSVGPEYLLSCLRLLFPFHNWNWNLRELPDHHYWVSPPSEEWKDDIIRSGGISFGGITFQATLYDFCYFNGGVELKEFWIRVYGYPQDLWCDTELRQFARDLGGIFIAHDPQSSLVALRMKIGVSDKEVISACRRLLFTDPAGTTHSHIVQIQVEDSEPPLWGTTRLPVFDATFIREGSVSPQPSAAMSNNILSLAPLVIVPHPTPQPLLVDLNSFPEDAHSFPNTNFLDSLFPNPNGMTFMNHNAFSIPLPNTPLPDIASPQNPLPLSNQSDILPLVTDQAPPLQALPEHNPHAPQPEESAIIDNLEPHPILQEIPQVPDPQPPVQLDQPQAPQLQLDQPPAPLPQLQLVPPLQLQLDQPPAPLPQPQPLAIHDAQPPNAMPLAQATAGLETEETRHSLRLKVKDRTGGPSRNRGRQGAAPGNTIIH